MRLCRFNNNRLGLVDGTTVKDVTSALESLAGYDYPLPRFDVLIAALPELRPVIEDVARTAPVVRALDEIQLLSPVANPGKIVAAPVNYRAHLQEVSANEQLHHQQASHTIAIHRAGLFLKATSSVVGPSEGVALRHLDRRNDHEVELAVVIGKRTDRVRSRDALQAVAGYCIGLDLSTRGPEERSFRKSIDTYTVLGPWLVTADEIPDPSGLEVSITVNGEPRQKGNTCDLILGVPELIEFATSFYTLEPGDVLLTGTPEGVAPLNDGDLMHAFIEKIGAMDVRVRVA